MAPSKRLATVTDVLAPGTSVGDRECVFPASRISLPAIDDETFVRLEKLSRKAANDSLRTKGGHLAEDQFDSLAVALLAIGIRAFHRFDREMTVSLGDGFNFAFKAMRGYRQGRFTEGPYIDWLRTNIRDSRFEPEGTTSVTATGELPEDVKLDEETFEQAAQGLSSLLSNRALETLHGVMRMIVVQGHPRALVALELDLPLQEIDERIDEMQSELRRAA